MWHLYAKRIDSSAAQVQVNSVNFMSENQSVADTAADDDVSPFPSSLSSGAIWAKDASVDSAAAAAEPGVGDGSSPTGVAGGEAADRKAPSLSSVAPCRHTPLPASSTPSRSAAVRAPGGLPTRVLIRTLPPGYRRVERVRGPARNGRQRARCR